MTVYAEMLKLALAGEGPPGGVEDSDPLARALARRSELGVDGDAATRLARSIAYDVALVRLCEQLGLEHAMTGPMAGPAARQETERMLAARLPRLNRALERR